MSLVLGTALLAAGMLFPIGNVVAEEEKPTPLAGEAFDTEVLGEPVQVAPRDRKNVTAASFGIQYLPDGPSFYQVLPFGALYVWRNSDDLKTTLSRNLFRSGERFDHERGIPLIQRLGVPDDVEYDDHPARPIGICRGPNHPGCRSGMELRVRRVRNRLSKTAWILVIRTTRWSCP